MVRWERPFKEFRGDCNLKPISRAELPLGVDLHSQLGAVTHKAAVVLGRPRSHTKV